jgi:hypothetical protein
MNRRSPPSRVAPPFARAAVAVAVLALAMGGCKSCVHTEPLAELVAETGSVSRDYAAHPEGWSPVPVGATFAFGDGLRTEAGSGAQLRMRGGGRLDMREATVLRFLTDASSAGRRVSLETGAAEIEMGSEGLEFETRFGTAKIEPGAHVRLTDDGKVTHFDVIVGSAIVESADASAEPLRAGQSLDLGVREPPVDAGAPPVVDAGPAADAQADDPTAILADVDGPGIRTATTRTSALVNVDPGTTHLEPGSRLVVPAGARVVVRRGAERATVSGAADLIVGGAAGALLEGHNGRVSVDATQTLVRVNVPGGSITVRGTAAAPASADVVLDAHETDVFARGGTTELHGRNKSITVLGGHDAAWLQEGGAIEKSIATSEPPEFTLPAGESATVHTMHVPAPVLVRVDPACGAGAYVEVARGGRFLPVGLAGTGASDSEQHAAVLSLGEGGHVYRVRCPDQVAAGPSGMFRVVRDSGAAHLPRAAGHNTLHADGRRYSVLYQNLLPDLTFDWPDAPPAEPLTLKVRMSKDSVDAVPLASTNSYSFPSGKLGDGTYAFWFELQRDAHLRSLETTVRVGFDNASPAAEIHEPEDGFEPKDGMVVVSGVAIEGARVSVGDTPIALDAQYRFKGEVPVAPGDHSIAIRIAHPARGVQYYLRRIGGS